jgi:hypothetical protein
MDAQKLNKALTDLTKLRFDLSKLKYDDEAYDTVEESLHDLEDLFLETYGNYLETIIREIHDEYCPDSEVLAPIAYLCKSPSLKGTSGDGMPLFEPGKTDGVLVDAEDYPNKPIRLVLVPGPARLLFTYAGHTAKELWKIA